VPRGQDTSKHPNRRVDADSLMNPLSQGFQDRREGKLPLSPFENPIAQNQYYQGYEVEETKDPGFTGEAPTQLARWT